ncbi:MAG: zinc ABC transporter substrate-binding protein [Bifidobacteriaceae bacterium]|jgi:zinc/manganese transport system substrate-binding protein|nr:zinc ABC transporter substrate-binding protein [Bifidobacteriaceae bacterium]
MGKKHLRAFAALGLLISFCSVALTSCTQNSEVQTSKCNDAPISVLATINQWGSLAKQIGGACVQVDSVISSPSQDPHEYEPNATDIAKFSNSKLIIINGAGYDEWAIKAQNQSGSNAKIINVGQINNVEQGANPHLFYSLKYIEKAAENINVSLSEIDSNLKDYFEKNYNETIEKYYALDKKISVEKEKSNSKKVGVSESVANYLLEEYGFKNLTPQGFAQSVANEGEVSANDLNSFSQLINGKKINLFIENIQEENNTTDQLVNLAKKNKIPIIKVTESMDENFGYPDIWLASIIENINSAIK